MKKTANLLLAIFTIMSFGGCSGSTAGITEFSFSALNPAAVGVINGAAVEVTIPFDTDRKSLVATFTTTGLEVSVGGITQVSGTTQNDFTKPVTYTVTAEDGSTNDFVVIVLYEHPFLNDLESFKFTADKNSSLNIDVVEEVNGYDITLRVPYGTDRTKLVATFAVNGDNVKVNGISQTSGITVNNYSERVIYSVIAEDGSASVYNIDVYMIVNREELDSMIAAKADVTRLDTYGITDMSKLFYEEDDFNQDISGWDVGNVTDMNSMFTGAVFFNQDISGWDVSNVTDMNSMFTGAVSFNQDISGWDVSNVTDMSAMFALTSLFNQDLSGWDVSKVTAYTYFNNRSVLIPDHLPVFQ